MIDKLDNMSNLQEIEDFIRLLNATDEGVSFTTWRAERAATRQG